MKRRKPLKRTPLKRSTKPIRQRSKKGQLKDRKNAEYKKTLKKVCCICGRFGNDLMHILPRSIFPQYINSTWNLKIGCRECHILFDNNLEFRALQNRLYDEVILKVRLEDKGLVNKYFKKI